MVGLELAIEQAEPARFQPRDQPRQRDLRRIGRAADHALAEKRPTQRKAVEAADKLVGLPAFDRMREADFMQPNKGLLDRVVDPGFGTIGRGFGA